MFIALPTTLNWMITSIAPEATLGSALQRSKCSEDPVTPVTSIPNDITTGTFELHVMPHLGNNASN